MGKSGRTSRSRATLISASIWVQEEWKVGLDGEVEWRC
jgi:hypothetical protein